MEVSLEYQQKNLVKLLESVTDACSQKNNFEFEGSGVSKVVDVWNEMRQVTAQMEEGNLIYRGKFNLCVLAINGDGTPSILSGCWNSSMAGSGPGAWRICAVTAPYLWRISAIALPELPALRSKQN